MDHLDTAQLADLAAGRGRDDQRQHVAECTGCREALANWEAVRGTLGPVVDEQVEDSELHMLRVLYRHHGPNARPTLREVVARLVRASAGSPAPAVRGAGAAELLEFDAGEASLVIEVSPAGSSEYALHGQILHDGGLSLDGGRIMVECGDRREVVVEPVSGHGEFHLRLPVTRQIRMTVLLADRRIRTDRFPIGEDERA